MISETIQVQRIRDGQPATVPILVAYDPARGTLAIFQDQRKRDQSFADKAYYRLEEFTVDRGRAFWLHRQQADIEADPSAVDRYAVHLGDKWDECDCKGKYASERRAANCKHVDCLKRLLAQGHLKRREMFGGVGA